MADPATDWLVLIAPAGLVALALAGVVDRVRTVRAGRRAEREREAARRRPDPLLAGSRTELTAIVKALEADVAQAARIIGRK